MELKELSRYQYEELDRLGLLYKLFPLATGYYLTDVYGIEKVTKEFTVYSHR